MKELRRFDDIVRSERYFTATLLPVLLFHDNFRGLRAFLQLIEGKATTEREADGTPKPRRPDRPSFSRADVEVITEFHIARDLKAAGVTPVSSQANPSELQKPDFAPEPETHDAPDLVIIVDDELIVCEGKFFSKWKPADLNVQLKSQRRQVELLFQSSRRLRVYRHIALLPVVYDPPPDCDAAITWTEVADLATEVLKKDHCVTRRFVSAIETFQKSMRVPGRKNYEGVLTLDDALSKCRMYGDAIQIGHTGGEADLARRSWEYIVNKPWKWRDPQKPKGKAVPKNWISGERFLEMIQGMVPGGVQTE